MHDEDIVTRLVPDDEAGDDGYLIDNEPDGKARRNLERFRAQLLAAITARGRHVRTMLAPLPLRRFVYSYWAEQPVIAANDHNRRLFPTWYSIASLRNDIESGLYRGEDLRLVKGEHYVADGEPATHPDGYREDGARARRFFDEEGGSIVIDDLHRYHRPFNEIWQELQSVFRFPITCTAYYTPAGGQTFPAHWDTDDVFVLQLEGSKHWTIGEPVIRDPLEHHRWGKYALEPGRTLLETRLEPGNVLYVPRGFPHTVRADAGAASLHVTLGVCIPTWHMGLKLLLQRAMLELGQQSASRQPCPPLLVTGAAPRSADPYMENLLAQLRAHLTPRNLRSAVEDFMTRQSLQGMLATPLAQPTNDDDGPKIGAGDTLYRNEQLAFLAVGRTALTLKFAGKAVTFPRRAAGAVRLLANCDRVHLCDLPDELDDDERQVLLCRLLREGYLTKRPPPAPP